MTDKEYNAVLLDMADHETAEISAREHAERKHQELLDLYAYIEKQASEIRRLRVTRDASTTITALEWAANSIPDYKSATIIRDRAEKLRDEAANQRGVK